MGVSVLAIPAVDRCNRATLGHFVTALRVPAFGMMQEGCCAGSDGDPEKRSRCEERNALPMTRVETHDETSALAPGPRSVKARRDRLEWRARTSVGARFGI